MGAAKQQFHDQREQQAADTAKQAHKAQHARGTLDWKGPMDRIKTKEDNP